MTVVLDDEEAYIRYFEHATNRPEESGWLFTNVPITTSFRVTRSFFEGTKDEFGARLVTKEDIERVIEWARGRQPFDPRNLDGQHVPGTHQQP